MSKSQKAIEPTPEQLREWVKNDLSSAVAFLNMLRNNPDILAKLQDIIIQRAQAEREESAVEESPALDFQTGTN